MREHVAKSRVTLVEIQPAGTPGDPKADGSSGHEREARVGRPLPTRTPLDARRRTDR